jgi:ComF family protein
VRGVFVAAGYTAPLGQALRSAKYRGRRPLILELAGAFSSAVGPALVGAAAAVVPAPTSWKRRLERGFSVPHLFASSLARRLDLPLTEALVARPGPQQAGLAPHQRRENVRGRVRSTRIWQGEDVILVDDVITTGATAEACARELLGSGARRVWLAALCAARPPPRPPRLSALPPPNER